MVVSVIFSIVKKDVYETRLHL